MNNENTLQTASQKAEVMLAFDRGEKVEWRHRGSKIWTHEVNPSWDWVDYEWRVMKKPVECWLWVHSNGTHSASCYDSKDYVEHVYKGHLGRAVFMREVI